MTRRRDETLSRAIGKAIANQHQLAGFTQAQAVEYIGVSDDAISKMEGGSFCRPSSDYQNLQPCITVRRRIF